MTRKEALTALLEKVEAGKMPKVHEIVSAMGDNYDRAIACVSLFNWACDADHIRDMGAALALHKAVLPGCSWEMRGSGFGGGQASVWNPMNAPHSGEMIRVDNDKPARALLIADLKYLIAQEDSA